MVHVLARIFGNVKATKCILLAVHRTFLSASYSCEQEWKNRLLSKTLSQINAAEHFRKVKQAQDNGRIVSSIDIDIIANKLDEIEPLSLDLVENIFYKFRHTNESVNMLESTSHALFKKLMDHEEYSRLFSMLEDKINYGLYLDSHMANTLMNQFLENKMYDEAIRIVFDLMLQEDFKDPITRALSYYACHSFVINHPNLKIEAPAALPNKPEIVFKKVKFIENPWYDDHFDLHNDLLKLGKSLTMLASPQDVVARGYLLVGYIMYHKAEKGFSLLQNWLNSGMTTIITENHVNLIESLLSSLETANLVVPSDPGLVRLAHLLPHYTEEQKANCIQVFQAFKEKLVKEQKILKDVNIEEIVKNQVIKIIEEHQEKDIEKQKSIYDKWVSLQEEELKKQIESLNLKQKKFELSKKLLDLTMKEEKLKYFEEKTKIDLHLQNQPEYPKIKEVVIEEQYVDPPSQKKEKVKSK